MAFQAAWSTRTADAISVAVQWVRRGPAFFGEASTLTARLLLSVILLAAMEVCARATDPEFERTLKQAIELLETAPTGKWLLLEARHKLGKDFPTGVVLPGAVSKTDAVLTRYLDPDSGKEQSERLVTIALKTSLTVPEKALDLAHELTHALARPVWDPYDVELTVGRFIQASLESAGGEIEALSQECQVARELGAAAASAGSRCQRYWQGNADAPVDREKVRADFYRVGQWKEKIFKQLGSEKDLFPAMSDQIPLLYSSTGRAPYPVALYKEFQAMNAIACSNSRKRLENLRSPASGGGEEHREAAQAFINRRCR